MVAREARSPGGAALLRGLVPSSEAETVRRRQDRLGEVRRALDTGIQAWPLDAIHDLRPWLEAARVAGAHLDAADLLHVADTLRTATAMRAFLDTYAESLPLVRAAVAGLQGHAALVRAIERAILPSGELADDATPELGRLRRRLVQQREALLQRLGTHLTQGAVDAYVTLRGERYVIPVRADAGRVNGIVHDRSATGGTLFVEPLDVVDANNELQALRDGEAREVLRILQDLSAQLGRDSDAVAASLDALERIDAWHAAARAAATMDAATPRLGNELRLHGARHPILQEQLRAQSRDVVPLDLELGGARALVVTGPNTGGKTVALKTVGLLVLMHQAGLQLPVHADSELPLVHRIVADIGDEQSIEAAESTFSSHLRHVHQAVDAAAPGLFALLDEFMAGTDPDEGAALAKVVLRRLVARGATTLVTTHLGALKLFAHAEPGCSNASMVFDAARGTPLFRLQPGVPGSSNALATAARLGFAADLVAAAAAERGPEATRIESVLRGLESERLALEAARATAAAATAEAQRLREEAATQMAALAHHRDRHLTQARRDVEALVEAARARIERTIRTLRESQASTTDIHAAREALQEVETSLPAATEPEPVAPGPLQVGDRVWIRPLGSEGRLEAFAGPDRAIVRYGPAAVTVATRDLERRAPSAKERPQPAPGSYAVHQEPHPAALELDLRGFERAEALQALDQFIDRAVLQGLRSVRIVHGKGTGVLRRAVHEHLATHAAVTAHRLGEHGEGGGGVTIAELH